MILPICLYGNPVLRKPALPVTPDYPQLDELIQNMFDTLIASDGCGLAAPQIGLSLRLFIVDGNVLFQEAPQKYPECQNFKQVFINPEIEILGNETSVYAEGCLSLPGIDETIKRPKTISVTFQTTDFQTLTQTFTDFNARIILHEYDHLTQHVFTDHLSAIRKQFVKKKLNDIIKGKITPRYKYLR